MFSGVSVLFNQDDEEESDRTIKTNRMGPWRWVRAAWPQLLNHGSGRIQMLASVSGKASRGCLAAYSISEFALLGLCQTTRNQGQNDRIRVTVICPGWVDTDMDNSVLAEPSEFWPSPSINTVAMTKPEDIASISSLLY